MLPSRLIPSLSDELCAFEAPLEIPGTRWQWSGMSVHIVIQGTSGCVSRFMPDYNPPARPFLIPTNLPLNVAACAADR